mgnify:CR=1 FL=1
MRINTMGMIQDISLNTKSRLNPDFTLQALDFEISSGRFRFSVRGSVDGNVLQVTTESAGSSRQLEIPVNGKTYLINSIMGAVATTFIAGVELARRGLGKPIGSLTQMGHIRLGKRTDSRSPLIKEFVPLARV